MVDWKRLGMAVLSVAFIGGVIAIILLFPKVLLAFLVAAIVCMIIFSFYKVLGDI